MENKMSVKQFLDIIGEYYEVYYEDEEGFNSDDAVGIVDLTLKFYEERRGKKHGK